MKKKGKIPLDNNDKETYSWFMGTIKMKKIKFEKIKTPEEFYGI